MPEKKATATVGRNAAGEIILCVCQMQSPAFNVRVVFDSPEAVARLADELAEHANDHEANAVPYAHVYASEAADQAAAMMGGAR